MAVEEGLGRIAWLDGNARPRAGAGRRSISRFGRRGRASASIRSAIVSGEPLLFRGRQRRAGESRWETASWRWARNEEWNAQAKTPPTTLKTPTATVPPHRRAN